MQIAAIKKNLAKIFFISLFSASALATASPVHTWHTVSAVNGSWQATLHMINQGGYFVNRKGDQIAQFTVNRMSPVDYGFAFDAGDDFDVAYTLTLVEKSTQAFVSKACVYVVTASGPAKPDIRATSFNGAKCDYKVVPGVGEDFRVS